MLMSSFSLDVTKIDKNVETLCQLMSGIASQIDFTTISVPKKCAQVCEISRI